MRSAGHVEPGSAIQSVEEVIGASAISGAPLHIVHINSTCLKDSLECLSLVEGARAHGIDVTTEAYPYIAGMTAINSAVFNPGWQEKLGISYNDLVLPDTGEHLTKERFDELHNSNNKQWVLIFANTQQIVDQLIPNPLIMIASDGAVGHPRNAGTYSRVLAQYVREKKSLTLMEALRKMTLMPAQMLERSTPEGKKKGRVQEGADADIVVFDPQTISDRSTFQKPMEPSVGVHYLLVGGTVLIDDSKMVSDVYPGKAIVGPGKSRIGRLDFALKRGRLWARVEADASSACSARACLLVLRFSAQQIDGVRKQFCYGFQRFRRAFWTARQIQNQGFASVLRKLRGLTRPRASSSRPHCACARRRQEAGVRRRRWWLPA